MFPYSDSGMSMRITAVDIDATGNAKVAWSRSHYIAPPGPPGPPPAGTLPAYAKTTNVNSSVPTALRGLANADTQLLMAEVAHVYRPAVGYVVTGDLNLSDRMFFVPRLTKQVKICTTASIDSCVTTI
jgi:hypothetical protein